MNDWETLEGVVARRVLDNAKRVSATLVELGVPHALVGGLAVGLHGHPRATKDVDFIVGAEAFSSTTILRYREELRDVVEVGVIDLIAALDDNPVLLEELAAGTPTTVPVVGIEVLVVMKLEASRTQDIADVEALVRAGADVGDILSFIVANVPELAPAFGELVQRALG